VDEERRVRQGARAMAQGGQLPTQPETRQGPPLSLVHTRDSKGAGRRAEGGADIVRGGLASGHRQARTNAKEELCKHSYARIFGGLVHYASLMAWHGRLPEGVHVPTSARYAFLP